MVVITNNECPLIKKKFNEDLLEKVKVDEWRSLMTEWISVKNQLPRDDEEVLILVDGFFPDGSILLQKRSFRIFQGQFNRSSGWSVLFCPEPYLCKFWMPLPNPLNENETTRGDCE